MVFHLPRERQRLPHKTRTTLTQRTEKAINVDRQAPLLASRRVPVLGDNGLVNRPQVGSHDRPLAVLRRQRLPQATRRELIAVAGGHAYPLPRATVQGRPHPPHLLLFPEETPHLI